LLPRLSEGVTAGVFVMLSVSDTGHGMTPEIKERVFLGQGGGPWDGARSQHGLWVIISARWYYFETHPTKPRARRDGMEQKTVGSGAPWEWHGGGMIVIVGGRTIARHPHTVPRRARAWYE
jgi:hypothetical protein